MANFLSGTLALRILAVAVLMPGAILAQEFDAASIKPLPLRSNDLHPIDRGAGGPGSADPGWFRCEACPLVSLVERAFDLKRYQFAPAPWMVFDEYRIEARLPEGTTAPQFRAMLQNFLKERFHLTYHFEKKEADGFALELAKGGPKLRESAGTPSDSPASEPPGESRVIVGKDGYPVLNHSGRLTVNGRSRFRADRQTTGDIARMLSAEFAFPVEDLTGLTGIYDVNLFWTLGSRSAAPPDPNVPVSPNDNPGPTFREAVEGQLGLRLRPKRVMVDVFVIDHVEKQPTAN